MVEETHVVEEIRWQHLFPWLRLARGPATAFAPSKLILAAMGLLLLGAGWSFLDAAFPGSAGAVDTDPRRLAEAALLQGQFDLSGVLRSAPERLLEPGLIVFEPFRRIFATETTGWSFLHATLSAAWGVVIWGIVGGAIADNGGPGDGSGPLGNHRGSSVCHSAQHGTGWSTAHPVCGRGCPRAPVHFFGFIYWIPLGIGSTLAGLLFFLPLMASGLMAVLLAGLSIAWPLMHASVATEGEDGFDALSRSYSYINQRPSSRIWAWLP